MVLKSTLTKSINLKKFVPILRLNYISATETVKNTLGMGVKEPTTGEKIMNATQGTDETVKNAAQGATETVKNTLGVKAIDHVSSIKSKSKVTGKSNSLKSRWVSMSKRVLSLQPVTQYNPITGEVRKKCEKAVVVKENSVVSKSKVTAVVSEKSTVVKESVVKSIEKLTVVKERDVTSKRKKLKIKAGLKRKRSGLDSSDSSEIVTKSIKLLISKLEKKVKKQESDEDSDKIEVTPSKIHDMLGVPFGGYSLFDFDERETDHEFVRKWAGEFYPLELKKVRVNDIAQKLIAAQEIDFLFKVNFLTLFMNTM
nr:ubiquitin-specific protease 13 [Tanacetum cinerariifolium]